MVLSFAFAARVESVRLNHVGYALHVLHRRRILSFLQIPKNGIPKGFVLSRILFILRNNDAISRRRCALRTRPAHVDQTYKRKKNNSLTSFSMYSRCPTDSARFD